MIIFCVGFTYSIKQASEIRKFHVAVVQRRLGNVQKGVMHVQSCCFTNINLLLFNCSRCRRRRRCFRELKQQPRRRRRRQLRKRHLKSEFALLQTLSRLIQFVKCWLIFLELNSKRLYQSSLRKRKRKPLY